MENANSNAIQELKREVLTLRQELQEIKSLQCMILEKLSFDASMSSITFDSAPVPTYTGVLPSNGGIPNPLSHPREVRVAFAEKAPGASTVTTGKHLPPFGLKMVSSHNLSKYGILDSPPFPMETTERVITTAMSNWEIPIDIKEPFRVRLHMWQECFDLFCQVMVNDIDAVIDLQFRAERGDLSAMAYLMILYGCGIGSIAYDPMRAADIADHIFPSLLAYDSSPSAQSPSLDRNASSSLPSSPSASPSAGMIDPADLPHAYFVLASCYEHGWGIRSPAGDADEATLQQQTRANLTQAVVYLRASARRGHAGAQNHLGHFYEVGLSCALERSDVQIPERGNGQSADDVIVPQIISEAVRWYSLAADQGYVVAYHNLGHCHAAQGHHLQALKFYQRAAERGYPPSIVELRK